MGYSLDWGQNWFFEGAPLEGLCSCHMLHGQVMTVGKVENPYLHVLMQI